MLLAASIDGPTAFWLIIAGGSALWVWFDAESHDFTDSNLARTRSGWVAGTLLLWIMFFPIYLARRGKAKSKVSPNATRAATASEPPPPLPAQSYPPPPPAAPANWYADPRGETRLRYWNGSAWTEHTAD